MDIWTSPFLRIVLGVGILIIPLINSIRRIILNIYPLLLSNNQKEQKIGRILIAIPSVVFLFCMGIVPSPVPEKFIEVAGKLMVGLVVTTIFTGYCFLSNPKSSEDLTAKNINNSEEDEKKEV